MLSKCYNHDPKTNNLFLGTNHFLFFARGVIKKFTIFAMIDLGVGQELFISCLPIFSTGNLLTVVSDVAT